MEAKISTGQVFMLLMVSRAFNILNYVPMFSSGVELSALLIGNLISVLINIALLIPAMWLFKKHPNQGLFEIAFEKSRWLGYIAIAVYFVPIVLSVIGTVTGFQFFMTNAVYPLASVVFIVVTICLACFFCAKSGIEGIARAGSIVFFMLLIGIIFITIVSLDSVRLLNIKPLGSNSSSSIYRATVEVISKNTEIYLLILLVPKIRGSFAKCSVWLMVAIGAFIEVTSFIMIAVLGEFAYTQTFPFYTLASIVETNILQRLDSVHMTLWVFISFIKITAYIIIALDILKGVLPKKVHRFSLPTLFVIVLVSSIIFCYHPEVISSLNSKFPITIVMLTAIIPLLLLIGKRGLPIEEKTISIDISAD